MTEFLKGFVIGLILWGLLFMGTALHAEELPEKPRSSTMATGKGLMECFPTDEFRKIVLWVEYGEHADRTIADLHELLETNRAELNVIGQEAAVRETQLRASEEEIRRLQLILATQQEQFDTEARRQRLRKGLTWGSISLLAAAAAAFGIAWGVSQ